MQYTGMRVRMESIKKGYTAQGLFDGKGVTVLAGSRANIRLNNISLPLVELRRSSLDSDGVLRKNLYFESPSKASEFICGRASNGWREWRFENGESLDVYRQKGIKGIQANKIAATRNDEPKPVVPKQETSNVEERKPEIRQSKPEIAQESQKDVDIAELMRQVAQLREMVLSKQNEGPAVTHVSEAGDRRFHIAIQHLDAPEIRLSQKVSPIRNLSFNLSFECMGEKGHTGQYRLFFLNEAFEAVSNTLDIEAKSGMSINCHFTLMSRMSKCSLCYLGIQDVRDAQDELQRLIPFEIQILFEADFDI